MSDLHRPRTFRLIRDEDVSGVSGTPCGAAAGCPTKQADSDSTNDN